MSAILEITFLSAAEIGDSLQFKYYGLFPDTGTEFTRGFNFATTRSYPGQCEIGSDAVTQAQNYFTAFTADYLTADFCISREVNVVTITCLNGSDVFEAVLNEGATFASFESPASVSDNMIHIINMTPRQYGIPGVTNREYLITEDDYFVLTEDNKKIRL